MKSKDTETLKDVEIGKDGNEKKNSTHKLISDDKHVNNDGVNVNSPRSYNSDLQDNQSKKMDETEVPGSVVYDKRARTLQVRCRDGWVNFHNIVLKGHRPMTAQDFYNGFLTKVPKDSHRFT